MREARTRGVALGAALVALLTAGCVTGHQEGSYVGTAEITFGATAVNITRLGIGVNGGEMVAVSMQAGPSAKPASLAAVRTTGSPLKLRNQEFVGRRSHTFEKTDQYDDIQDEPLHQGDDGYSVVVTVSYLEKRLFGWNTLSLDVWVTHFEKPSGTYSDVVFERLNL